MSNLFLRKNFHFFFAKLKSSQPPAAPSSDCYFTSNPISLTPSSTAAAAAAADDDDDDFFSSSSDSTSDDFAAVLASRRFFFSSPGRSNSIFDSSAARSRSHHNDVVSEGLRIPKYSTDPYADFRRSMQEMVEARDMENNVRNDSEFLRELLSCYLRLNPKNTHKFIVRAFADLVLSLLASPSPAPEPAAKTRRKFVMLR